MLMMVLIIGSNSNENIFTLLMLLNCNQGKRIIDAINTFYKFYIYGYEQVIREIFIDVGDGS